MHPPQHLLALLATGSIFAVAATSPTRAATTPGVGLHAAMPMSDTPPVTQPAPPTPPPTPHPPTDPCPACGMG